ncbi:uncharacterized protein LOC110890666 [Helianthus annuus]|uniref:uncharacterized protein LOC110890666 n=1 Tax=Helianthus annuus TaxID=4232 RepID=UPI000B8FACCB|nr:uncharacterized protein LOC110890666 [Helianthus annuus]
MDEVTELNALTLDLSSVTLNNSPDSWKWLGDSSGVFSVSSVRRLMEKSAHHGSNFVLEWCKWIPIKCDVFVWRAEMGRIPTVDALRRRGITVGDGLCSLCRSGEESADHLFISCVVASTLWQKVSHWCRIPPIFAFSIRELLELHKTGNFKAGEKFALQGIIRVGCRCLWLARNNAIFSDKEVKALQVKSIKFFGKVRLHRVMGNGMRAKLCHISTT